MAEKVDGSLTQYSDQNSDALLSTVLWTVIDRNIDSVAFESAFTASAAMLLNGASVDESVAKFYSLVGVAPAHLSIWSGSNNEQIKYVMDNYSKKCPEITSDIEFLGKDMYLKKLDKSLATTDADVVMIDEENIRAYVESGNLLDITDVCQDVAGETFEFMQQEGCYNGKCYALSMDPCPGVMYYRRSFAKKYLGTDDPEKVQAFFEDFDAFMAAAERIDKKSKGKCKIVGSIYELQQAFAGSRSSPWIQNGSVTVDPVMKRYMEVSKELISKGYVTQNGYPWSDEWFMSMNDELNDDKGKRVQVFAYFMPSWGAKWQLEQRATKTAGDWAVIKGPARYFGGGIFIAAPKNAKNSASVKNLMRYMMQDTDFLTYWGREDSTFLANKAVMNSRKTGISNKFLKGQNPYPVFISAAEAADASFVQKTDREILNEFQNAVNDYVWGKKDMAQALADFEQAVNSVYGD